jgi:hypothetical protein
MKVKSQVNYGMKLILQHKIKDANIMYEIIAAQGKRADQSYDSYIERYGQLKNDREPRKYKNT